MGFSRQEYGVGCHFLLQGIFPNQGSKLLLLCIFCIAGRFFTQNDTQFTTCELFIFGIFHLIFLDHGWLQVTEIVESETVNKGDGSYCIYERNHTILNCQKFLNNLLNSFQFNKTIAVPIHMLVCGLGPMLKTSYLLPKFFQPLWK